ncbi:MAG: (Fe-S)-binding protein [Gammaproteobacteria bacterium]
MSIKLSVEELKLAADQCVKCAVCLPHCPTYALSPEEAESPRGRISLLQGIVHERLKPTRQIQRHLDSCLSCGRCEQVCPANVPYTRLLDGGRFWMERQAELEPVLVSRTQRFAARLLNSPRLLRVIAAVMKTARRLNAHTLFKDSLVSRVIRWMPTSEKGSGLIERSAPERLTATLFTGCLSDSFEQDLAASARIVSAAYGVRLTPTPKGLCCGALYQHQGNERQSSRLAEHNLAVLGQSDDPIVSLQSGCSRGLADGLRFSGDAEGQKTAARITDLFALIAELPTPSEMRNSSDKVGVYAPCSSNKRERALMLEVLQRSQPDTLLLGSGHGCCGAAGDHMVTRPERADQLAQPIVDEIMATGLTHILVPNMGCAWHLRANLSFRQHGVIIEHPLQWLARHLSQ